MPFDPHRHHRRSIRLPDYDYSSSGAYFVTLCTYRHTWLFGEICAGELQPSAFGSVALAYWRRLPQRHTGLKLDAFVLMPNHLHGILIINRWEASGLQRPCALSHPRNTLVPESLGAIIGAYKTVTTRCVNRMRHALGQPLWQRNYWEHIIRNADDLDRIRRYIHDNPSHWEEDRLFGSSPDVDAL